MNVRRIVTLSLLLLGPTLVGCQTSSMTPGQMSFVQPVSDQPRQGNAYLMRGWIGVFSTGIDSLTEQLNDSGVRAEVFQETQWKKLADTIRETHRDNPAHEPIVLIGHSYGADNVIRIARELEKDQIEVELLVTLDPVTPPAIPSNVKKAINLYQPNGAWDVLPVLRGVAVKPASDEVADAVENWNLRDNRRDLLEQMDGKLDHFNIEKKEVIHDTVKQLVLEHCPPRDTFVAVSAAPHAASSPK